jgi:hypothetical protein
VVVEEVKLAVLELIRRQLQLKNEVRNADFITREVGKSYRTLSELFVEHEKTTIEKYIVQ